MRFKAFIDNLLKKNKRQKITMISVVFIVYVMLLAGIFSYFQSEDMVTNRMEAKNDITGVQIAFIARKSRLSIRLVPNKSTISPSWQSRNCSGVRRRRPLRLVSFRR